MDLLERMGAAVMHGQYRGDRILRWEVGRDDEREIWAANLRDGAPGRPIDLLGPQRTLVWFGYPLLFTGLPGGTWLFALDSQGEQQLSAI